jgi:NADH dehydrogenase [ubiquinone] 1 alpha subcomplex assembly factor 1
MKDSVMPSGPGIVLSFTGLTLMTALFSTASADPPKLVTDFSQEPGSLEWFVVNDDVMGGRSSGGFELNDGNLMFTGSTNTRGGGFSSIRSQGLQMDLSEFSGIRLRVRGDGRQYSWQLRTNAMYRGRELGFWSEFETTAGQWLGIDLPFADFVPKFRGNKLDVAPPNPAHIMGLGLMISDGKDGPFAIAVDSVQAYRESEPFSLGDYQWENRLLVVSSPAPDEPKFARQLQQVAATGREFGERDLVLISLATDGTSLAGKRKLDPTQVEEIRATLGIDAGAFAVLLVGKDGTVKLSKNSIVPMDDIYALIDKMPMRQREIQRD